MKSSDYFSVNACTPLKYIHKGGAVHIIGICGVAMAQLALELVRAGYVVSGSDRDYYEPMKSLLEREQITLFREYTSSNVRSDYDLVVIGNAASYTNDEVLEVEKLGLKYTFFSKVIYELLIEKTHSIVITGTHGKSTTTALASYVYTCADADPSYFIGGQSFDLEQSLKKGSGSICIVEGDEYDSAFFAKVPKFSFYKPNTLIITSLEFDHADIYSSLQDIVDQFEKLLCSLSENDTVLCCLNYPTLSECFYNWKEKYRPQFLSYGVSQAADFRILHREVSANGQKIAIANNKPEAAAFQDTVELSTKLQGEYNALNVAAVYIISRLHSLREDKVLNAIKGFQGLKRRQEILFERKDFILYEDFAHHPTAVTQTLQGLRERYHDAEISAVFEPRSNTSRRKIFQNEYTSALMSADNIIIQEVAVRHNDTANDLLNTAEIKKALTNQNKSCVICRDSEDIYSYIINNLLPSVRKNSSIEKRVIVIMSNGSFGGLSQKLKTYLNSKAYANNH
jgi:UDP-N-acetylmuramate: L-alanyl-gamma-D-glutamyl-meso-diaminopimelate ligase